MMYNFNEKTEQEQYFQDCRAIEVARAKALEVERVKLEAFKVRQMLREQERKRKKKIGEEVVFAENGEVWLIETNLGVEAEPRQFTNMKGPRLVLLVNREDDEEVICRIDCFVGQHKKSVFIDPEKVGTGSYLIRKFAAVGIDFKLKTAEAKRFARRLFCVLLEYATDKEELPAELGWNKDKDGNFQFVTKEDMTWEKAKKKAS